MSVAKNVELSAASKKSFEDAIRKGIKKAAESIDSIESAWIKEQKIVVNDGEVDEYRVIMKITFIVK